MRLFNVTEIWKSVGSVVSHGVYLNPSRVLAIKAITGPDNVARTHILCSGSMGELVYEVKEHVDEVVSRVNDAMKE